MSYYYKVKLKVIENDSGVSVSSVSMILNKREGVSFSNETVEKVLSSAKKLGYEISSSQKEWYTCLQYSKIRKVYCYFCPNISNSYYSTIAQSIEQAAYQKGFKTLIITTFRDEALEKEFLQDMIKLHVSGIVFTMMPQCPQFLEKVAKKYPVIVIGDKTTDIDLNVIETSNYTAGVLMAEHLYELGHRNIAFLTTTIGKSLSLAMRYQRLKAIQNTYKKLCMNEPYNIIVKESKIDPELERKNIFLEHGVGYQLCNECLDDRNLANLTAFIGNNDMVSYGIMDAILKKGYQIPDDFSVCGFDNDFASSLLPISLTTVEHYMEDKGKKAFDMIYEKIQEKDDFFVQDDKCVIRIEYKSKLISRDSTNVARTRKNINL
ncbi:MAG: LacI family DNA-binding transcriptional regulator [Anaerostipes sp.]|uniref:LacI family DNA-binding transcriptional regulator n=1 Tax=Anaerostipes sp. TaxID=1872530 RepID=UPI0039A1893E